MLMNELDQDEQFYRDTESLTHPKLDDRQLAVLEPLGVRRILRRGELVYKAGQRDVGLTVVLRGAAEVFESRDGQEQILGTFGPRNFAGDVAALMAPRQWPTCGVGRRKVRFWKCPPAGCDRRWRNCPE